MFPCVLYFIHHFSWGPVLYSLCFLVSCSLFFMFSGVLFFILHFSWGPVLHFSCFLGSCSSFLLFPGILLFVYPISCGPYLYFLCFLRYCFSFFLFSGFLFPRSRIPLFYCSVWLYCKPPWFLEYFTRRVKPLFEPLFQSICLKLLKYRILSFYNVFNPLLAKSTKIRGFYIM